MRKFTTMVLLTTGLITLGAGMAQGAGFNIYEAGVRATALGGAFTASADDGSALFYNAAGLSFQEGRSASINLMPVNPRFKFRGATTFAGEGAFEEVQHKTYLVPGAYYTARPSEKFSYGLGVYAPFGLGVKWMNPDTFVGRQVSYDVEIQTVYVTPGRQLHGGRWAGSGRGCGRRHAAPQPETPDASPHPGWPDAGHPDRRLGAT